MTCDMSSIRSVVLIVCYVFVFFNDTSTTEIYTLSLHDALPIWTWTRRARPTSPSSARTPRRSSSSAPSARSSTTTPRSSTRRSEEHTSELQSRQYLVCRLLLEKKKEH